MSLNEITSEVINLQANLKKSINRPKDKFSDNFFENKKEILKKLETKYLEVFNKKYVDIVDVDLKTKFDAHKENFFKIVHTTKDILSQIETRVRKMAMTKVDFLKLATTTLNHNFSGDPLKLNGFLDSIELLETMADSAENKQLLVTIIKTRLEGTARELVTNDLVNSEQIIKVLRSNIKPENSKIVEGKLTALRIDRVPLQEFSEKVNTLAESFKRALVVEGITSAKANELTINKTIEVCRANARTDLVKAILSSSAFDSPKEVVSKFIVEINSEIKEKQVLAYRTFQNKNKNNKKHFNKNNRYNNNGYNKQNNSNWNNKNHNQYNNYNNKNNQNKLNRNNNVRVIHTQENLQNPVLSTSAGLGQVMGNGKAHTENV